VGGLVSVQIELKEIRVRSLDIDFNELSWKLVDTSEDILDYNFQILRSESPSGPFEPLGGIFQDRYFFIDNTIQAGHRWRKYFYNIRVTNVPSGDHKDFGPVAKEPEADLVAAELRRHMQLLFREFAGRRCWVIPVRTFGQRCFLPGSMMQGAVIGASRAHYEGKAVQLTTKKGLRLSVTANHPVLTMQGLVPAQSVCVGDYLVSYLGESEVGILTVSSEGDEQKAPALAEDVFGALAKLSQPQAARAGGEDFHGEAKYFVGDVEVVGSYGSLLLHRQSAFSEQAGQHILVAPPPREFAGVGLCAEHALFQGLPTSSGSSVSSAHLSLASCRAKSVPAPVLRLGQTAQANSPLLQCRAEALSRNTALPSQLLQRGAGLIAFDEVIDVCVEDYLGHVFDFETLTGWIVANGIVTSNCSCWNSTLKQRQRSGCLLCFDTSYVRGYMHPIESWIQFDPSPKTEQQTNVGPQQQSNTTARMCFYPSLKPQDLIIEPENRRWKVVQVSTTEHLRAVVHHELQLHEVPPKDIEFSIPLNLEKALKDLWLSPSRNFYNPQDLNSFLDAEAPGIYDMYTRNQRR